MTIWPYQKRRFKSPLALADVSSKTVFLLLSIHCLLLLPLFVVLLFLLGSCSAMHYFVSVLVLQSCRWVREREPIALLVLFSGYCVTVMVLCLLHVVHWVILQCMIVAFTVIPTYYMAGLTSIMLHVHLKDRGYCF